ncbi:MAG: hypothetical protein WAQ08_17870 [Aquabacterium sp.]
MQAFLVHEIAEKALRAEFGALHAKHLNVAHEPFDLATRTRRLGRKAFCFARRAIKLGIPALRCACGSSRTEYRRRVSACHQRGETGMWEWLAGRLVGAEQRSSEVGMRGAHAS